MGSELFHDEGGVVFLAAAEEDVLAVVHVGVAELVAHFLDTLVVDVGSSFFDGFFGFAAGVGESGVDEGVEEEQAVFAGELVRRNLGGGDFAGDIGEGVFGDAVESAAEEDFRCGDGVLGGVLAVDEVGHLGGEGVVGDAGAGVFGVLLFEFGDLLLGEKGEELEVADDVAVVDVYEVLVEAVDAGLGGIEPDGAFFRFAELGAVGVGDEGEGEAVDGVARFFACELGAYGDVAPLVGAADLELAAFRLVEVVEVVALQEHVGELGEGDAGLLVAHAGLDGVLADHGVDRDVLAGVAEEVEEADLAHPGGVVDELSGVFDVFGEVEQAGELDTDLGDVVVEDFLGEQLAFGLLAGGIADGSGGTAGEGDGLVAVVLEASQSDERNEVAHVQAVGGGVEAGIQGDGSFF